MMWSRWRGLLVFVLLLLSLSSNARAAKNLYLYDPSVASDIDLNAYLLNGTVQSPTGKPFNQNVQKGPAPAPFPTIAVSENSFEQLGASNAQIDGVVFVNHANFYVPGRRALVLWTIRVPGASSRTAGEFQSDLTLALWIDWNQDNAWRPGECMIRKSLSLHDQIPTTENEIVVTYLASFQVPDAAEILAMQSLQTNAKYGSSGKDIHYMWARAVLSYDDPDMSPDGAQLFGEYEDYRVAYYIPSTTASGGSR